jgi:hypothetical protein
MAAVTKNRKISQKSPEYLLNYSLPCSCRYNLSSFWFILKQQWTIEEISIFNNSSHFPLKLLNQIKANLAGMVLGGPLSIVCPTVPPSIQNGCCY